MQNTKIIILKSREKGQYSTLTLFLSVLPPPPPTPYLLPYDVLAAVVGLDNANSTHKRDDCGSNPSCRQTSTSTRRGSTSHSPSSTKPELGSVTAAANLSSNAAAANSQGQIVNTAESPSAAVNGGSASGNSAPATEERGGTTSSPPGGDIDSPGTGVRESGSVTAAATAGLSSPRKKSHRSEWEKKVLP